MNPCPFCGLPLESIAPEDVILHIDGQCERAEGIDEREAA